MKHRLSLSIFLFFSSALCSEQTRITQPNKDTLEYFFPIEESHKRIVTVTNTNQFSSNLKECLHSNTKLLLKDSQNNTYGFCYAGMLKNSANDPKLILINHQYPFFLNLQMYQLSTFFNGQSAPILMQSTNIDPTFHFSYTKKQPSLYNAKTFWQTSTYNHKKIAQPTKSSMKNKKGNSFSFISQSSFWGPFFESQDKAGCFFYTNIPSRYIIRPHETAPYMENNPPYIILHHTINKAGNTCHKICYSSYDSVKYYPLYADTDKYFLVVLATFFPSKEVDNKKIFFTNKYSIKELLILQVYINSFKEEQPMIPSELTKHVKNKTIYELFLHSIMKKPVNVDFYKEINEKIDTLIGLKRNN